MAIVHYRILSGDCLLIHVGLGLQVHRLRQEVAEEQQRSEELLRARANAAAEQQAKDEEVKGYTHGTEWHRISVYGGKRRSILHSLRTTPPHDVLPTPY